MSLVTCLWDKNNRMVENNIALDISSLNSSRYIELYSEKKHYFESSEKLLKDKTDILLAS